MNEELINYFSNMNNLIWGKLCEKNFFLLFFRMLEFMAEFICINMMSSEAIDYFEKISWKIRNN